MNTRITELLNIEYPIIQGAMAWVAEHKLASAVSEAGGLGIIAGGSAPYEIIKNEIKKAREITNKPLGLNIMLLSEHADDLARLAVEEKIEVVTTGAGNPGKYMEMWKEAGIKVIPVVASVALARRMEKAGADAIIAEGQEAGGHIGECTSMTLIPQVVDAVKIPVIGAGGVADGRGIVAMEALGASAVQLGTIFLTAEECVISRGYKDAVLKAGDISTVVTGRSTGHPVRSLKNDMARDYLSLEKKGATVEELEAFGANSLRNAVLDGDPKKSSYMSGQIAGLVNSEKTCKQTILDLMEDYETKKANLLGGK